MFTLKRNSAGPYLRGDRDELRQASIIPGTRVHGGRVEGPVHALNAVLRMAGVEDRIPGTWADSQSCSASVDLPAYQKLGTGFIYNNASEGVMVNDDVGLGKTVQTIAACLLREKAGEDEVKVVLCPGSLRTQWAGEITRWSKTLGADEQEIYTIWPQSDKRSTLPIGNPKWIIAFYLNALNAMAIAENLGKPYLLIIDEIHNLGGYRTLRSEAMQQAVTFSAGRIGLTASKLWNKGDKLYPIVDYIRPTDFGGFKAYAKRYCGAEDGEYGVEIGKLTKVPELRYRLSHFSFRRTKEEVWDQLPFSVRYQTAELDPLPNKMRRLREAIESKHGRATHHQLVAMAKVDWAVETIKSDCDAKKPSLSFTWLREQAEEVAAKIPWSLLVLGGTNSSKRLEEINRYVARCKIRKVTPCIIGTYGAFGEGGNLQFAKVVNLLAISDTPDVMHQGIGRAARMGQEGEVIVRIPKVKHSIDERLVAISMDKLSEQVELEGKPEKAKTDLKKALGPASQVDALKRMYERIRKEEGL